MEKSSWIWGRKGKRSLKEEVPSPVANSSAAQLIAVGGGGGDDHHVGNGEGKSTGNLIMVAAPTVSLEVSGEPDYPPRKFNKYGSIAEVYTAAPPLTIVENSKPRMKSKPPTNDVVSEGENSKKLAKRIVKKMKAIDEEEGNSKAALTSNSDFIDAESLEEAEMEACPTRNPRFQSILELYEVTQQPATASVMLMN